VIKLTYLIDGGVQHGSQIEHLYLLA